MSQNTSSAVMQQRREAKDSLDDFPTPPWATRALLAWLARFGFLLRSMTVREPAANRGHMVKPLQESFGSVIASDVYDYGAGFPISDYLFGSAADIEETDWTITNPPFRLAEQFIARALERSRVGVAMLVRTSFLESEGRADLFAKFPPSYVLVFAERVVILRGRLVRSGEDDPQNIDPKTGKPRKASTATSYSWLIWDKEDPVETRLQRIEKCRLQLERRGDYPA